MFNPTQPLPPILASTLCPPPVWPLPTADWLSLPVVAVGMPAGPFTPTYTGPVGTGAYPGPSSCPGSGIGGGPLVPAGAVASVTVTNGGTGYTTVPTVTINTTTGSGAVLTATIAGGEVTGITITSPGSGYAPTDTISITGGGGTGATATMTVTT